MWFFSSSSLEKLLKFSLLQVATNIHKTCACTISDSGNMDITHCGIRQQVERGGLSVRLLSNAFARKPVDLALESTINVDAISRQTGITDFHQSQEATRHWTVTRSARSTIVRYLVEKSVVK